MFISSVLGAPPRPQGRRLRAHGAPLHICGPGWHLTRPGLSSWLHLCCPGQPRTGPACSPPLRDPAQLLSVSSRTWKTFASPVSPRIRLRTAEESDPARPPPPSPPGLSVTSMPNGLSVRGTAHPRCCKVKSYQLTCVCAFIVSSHSPMCRFYTDTLFPSHEVTQRDAPSQRFLFLYVRVIADNCTDV